jgi:hypothetical protein
MSFVRAPHHGALHPSASASVLERKNSLSVIEHFTAAFNRYGEAAMQSLGLTEGGMELHAARVR